MQRDEGDSELQGEVSELQAWKRRALSLEMTEEYLLELLHIKERQLQAIIKSPAWKLSKPLRLLNLLAWKINPDLEKIPELRPPDSINISGKTVVELEGSKARFELQNAGDITNKSKVALVASYSPIASLPPSLELILQSLVDQDFVTILIFASEDSSSIGLDKEISNKISIIRKNNIGYDFGSWAIANQLLPDIANAGEVLLINDSVILDRSKLHSFVDLIRKAKTSPFDVTSATDTQLHSYHLQSYFLHFKNGSFGNKKIQKFIHDIRPQSAKSAVIFAYEIGLSITLRNNGLTTGANFPWNRFSDSKGNSSIHSWRELLESGSPFIKREVFKGMTEAEMSAIEKELEKNFNFNVHDLRISLSHGD